MRLELDNLHLKPPSKYLSILDFSMFDYVPETPNDALQESIQEKIRIFNNSALPLFDYYNLLMKYSKDADQKNWDSPSNIQCRQYIRQEYLELFVYKEKLIRFVADIFHFRIKKNEKTLEIVKMISKMEPSFPFIKTFIDKSKKTNDEDTDYQYFLSVRNDEVHNITRIDRINYTMNKSTSGLSIIPVGYCVPTSVFIENIDHVLTIFVDLKGEIQRILDNQDLIEINKACKIYK